MDFKTTDYTIAIQRAIEYHCKDRLIPEDIATQCPHYAEMLNRHLTSQCSGRDSAWFCSTCKHDENHGEFCDSCGEPRR